MRSRRLKGTGVLDGMVNRAATDCSLQMGSNALVYLIHGVTGAPVEMHYLAKSLARQGWDVYVPTLPGHCTRIKDLLRTGEQDWRAHVETQLAFARERYESVFVAGLSGGALLALDASTVVEVEGVGVMSPTFVYDGWNTPWSNAILPFAMKLVPLCLQRFLFHIDGPPFGIKDPVLQARVRAAYRPMAILREWLQDLAPRRHGRGAGDPAPSAASNGYPIFPLRTLTELDRLMTRVRSRLGRVTAPTVIVQAQEDDMTSPRNATMVYDAIASKEKRLVLLDDCYHVMTVDRQKHLVAASLADFFALPTSKRTLDHRFSRETSEYGIR